MTADVFFPMGEFSWHIFVGMALQAQQKPMNQQALMII
jgi:hypothetical protein